MEHSWAKIVHSKLICMLTNMLYEVSDVQNNVFDTHFIPDRIELLGGIDYICLEVGPTLYLSLFVICAFHLLIGIVLSSKSMGNRRGKEQRRFLIS